MKLNYLILNLQIQGFSFENLYMPEVDFGAVSHHFPPLILQTITVACLSPLEFPSQSIYSK